METIDNVLIFWFGNGQTSEKINEEKNLIWWSKNKSVDREIMTRFVDVIERISKEELNFWRNSPKGVLASIICLDQFPRSIFRGTPDSFSYDNMALRFAKNLVETHWNNELPPIYRAFGYLPFEHSEELNSQTRSLELYEELRRSVDAKEKGIF